jgi:NlpC/P60 family
MTRSFITLSHLIARSLLVGAVIAIAAPVSVSAWLPGAGGLAHAQAVDPPTSQNSELILRSLGLLGVDYKWGGNTPAEGMDCSGFVRHVFRDALGLSLPRRSEEISAYGDIIERDQLLPGDLVFFNTAGRPFSHVGLYLGNQQFVHAPSTGNVIRVESMRGNYWARRYDSARRITAANGAAGPDLPGLDRLVQNRSQGERSVVTFANRQPTALPAPQSLGRAAGPYAKPSAPQSNALLASSSYMPSRTSHWQYSAH